jgi:hypothetical protein
MIDIQEKKRKILEFLKSNGPSLPVQVARAIQMEPVFASAILSELISSKEIKTSHMKVGASPLYLLPTQTEKLEEKTENLKSVERETQEKLKSEKIIYDESEEPATRIALRNIKDFAIPFKFKDKIVWKYAFTPKEEIDKILFPKEEKEKPQEEEPEVPKAWEVKRKEINEAKDQSKKIERIFEKPKEHSHSDKTFLEKIERFLKEKDTEITAIEEVDKKKVTAIIKSNEETSMLFAFNKIRINESELLKCFKIAEKKNLPYQIITNGDLTKKLTDTIRAYQKLIRVEKLEN